MIILQYYEFIFIRLIKIQLRFRFHQFINTKKKKKERNTLNIFASYLLANYKQLFFSLHLREIYIINNK